MPRVVHFEIDAEKPERAIKFYERVFGWKIEKWKGPMEYWLIINKIEKNGGSISRPKMAVPGVGWMAYFKDPEGNFWGIMKTDKNAK
jgi:predicted enzyme related to lactoylglutathione lyase